MKKEIADREAAGALLNPQSLSAQERLKKRIADLTSLSQQIETQRRHLVHQKTELANLKSDSSVGTPQMSEPDTSPGVRRNVVSTEAIDTLDESSRSLEQQLNAAERETAELENELKKLDQTFNARLAELNLGIDDERLSGTLTADAIESSALSNLEDENLESSVAPADGQTVPPVPLESDAMAQADEAPPAAVAQGGRSLRSVANVISLAARSRSQQKQTGD
jgi:hypothetical protein